jgi:putative cell wall-binding protein
MTPSVSIQLPTATSLDGWGQPPLIAQLIPQGPGVMWYRFGAGPGPWQPLLGPVIIPPGKQLLSAVLVAPDGVPGPVTTLVARSDIHATLAATSADSRTVEHSGETSAAGMVTVSVLVARQLGTVVRRIGGTTRYGTGAAISGSVAGRRDTVIIATGENFPDALTASGLAGCLDAPVLLVHKRSIPSETASEIRRLKAKRAVIIGGTPAVSDAVAKKLRGMRLSVERLSGKTRYETAVAVSKRIQKLTGKSNRVFIARGTVFSDALIVAPLAYATRAPILLSGSGTLYPSTAYRLTAARYQSATLIGGGLSSRVESGVRQHVRSVGRWAGANQYDTAVQVAANSALEGSLSWGYVGIARGDIFPDALCGGALCGKKAGVILLTPSKSLYPGVANALQAHMSDVARCEIYGSDKAVTAAVFNQINAIFR